MSGMQQRILFSLCLLFWAVCLGIGMGVRAEAAETGCLSFYEDGDVVGCIGDSITHVTYGSMSYVEMLDQYYLSRFPERRIEFRNLGAAGYKAGDILNIYDQDPAFRGIDKAVIMLGTNEAILGYSPEDYIGDMERLIERLKEDGLEGEDILILSPPLCDQNCALNYRNGRPRWTFEDRLLAYMERLEAEAEKWGIYYLDFHTPMAELTARLQKENAGNTLTTDCVHPDAAGQRLIAYYILQAQGAKGEPLSEISVSDQQEITAVRDEVTDFYRGARGMKWTWRTETLPVAATDDLTAFRALFDEGNVVYRKTLRVVGFSEDALYRVLMGETELGSFTGKELEGGIDFSVLEGYKQDALRQVYDLEKKRHQAAVAYRNMWIEVMMQRAVYTQEQIQTEYERWRASDERLRSEISAIVAENTEDALCMVIVEEGYSAEELEQEALRAKESAEQARREAAERARKEARERARKEAAERAGRAAEQAGRAAVEQAGKGAQELAERASVQIREAVQQQGERKRFLQWGIAGLASGMTALLLIVLLRKSKEPIDFFPDGG